MAKGLETVILRTKLEDLFSVDTIEHLLTFGYKKTGLKFGIYFSGSKGYLDHISIDCELNQSETNRIDSSEIFNKDGSVKKKKINVYHSKQKGIRVSLGSDKSRVVEIVNWGENPLPTDDELPF